MSAEAPSTQGQDPVVVYSVRELLAEIRDDVKESVRRLDSKADKAEMIELEHRVAGLEQFRWKVAGFAFAFSLVGGGGAAGLFKVLTG